MHACWITFHVRTMIRIVRTLCCEQCFNGQISEALTIFMFLALILSLPLSLCLSLLLSLALRRELLLPVLFSSANFRAQDCAESIWSIVPARTRDSRLTFAPNVEWVWIHIKRKRYIHSGFVCAATKSRRYECLLAFSMQFIEISTSTRTSTRPTNAAFVL